MGHLVRLRDVHTAVRPTELVEARRQPTHPAVRAPGCRQGPGLSDFPLLPETTRAVVTLDHAGVDRLVTPARQPMRKTGFAMDHSDCHALHPTIFVGLFPLPLGQPLAPAHHRMTPPPLGRRPTTEHLQAGRLVAGQGLGEKRRLVPCSQTIVGGLSHSQGLLVGPLAHPQGHHPRAVSGHGGLRPPVARCTPCMIGTAFLLFFTPRHCASHAKAMGRRSRPCGSCKRSA